MVGKVTFGLFAFGHRKLLQRARLSGLGAVPRYGGGGLVIAATDQRFGKQVGHLGPGAFGQQDAQAVVLIQHGAAAVFGEIAVRDADF